MTPESGKPSGGPTIDEPADRTRLMASDGRHGPHDRLLDVEGLYRIMFEQAGDAVFLFDPAPDDQLIIVEANAAALRAHGYAREELVGQPVTVLDPFASHEFFEAELSALRAGKSLVFDVCHVCKDGSTIDLEVRSSLVTLGSRQLVLSIERDIAARKRTETQLKHSRDLMRYVIEHARSAIAVHDRDLKYVYVSQQYLRAYNVRERDVIGKHHYDVFPDLPQKWRDVHQRALAGEVSSAEEDPYVRADGTVDWTRWECRPWYEADGTIGGIIVYTEVITDRKRIEQRIRQSESDLKRSQAIAHVGHWVWDSASDSLRWSDEMKRIFGFDEAVESKALNDLALRAIHPDDVERVRAATGTVLADGLSGPMEFRIIRPDGSIRHVLAVQGDDTIDRESGGRVSGVIQDLTDLRQSEEERKQLERQLQQAMKMEAVGRLAGGIAHDFNNLLTGISGNVELALMDLSPANPLADMLRSVGEAAGSAAALTRQLLAFSRKQIIDPKVLNLNELIANVHKMLVRLIGEDIALRIVPGGELGLVRVDAGQIEQVLVNLAVNARDAMPDGGQMVIETANVELDDAYQASHPHARPGPFVMVAVSDTGCGMDDKVKQHLFEPFFTTKPVGRGTGLGLATIFGVVKQAGGSIEVYSELGEGTSFKIYLPRVTGQAVKLEPARRLAVPAGGDEVVLLVEDDAVVRDLVRRILIRLGYAVLEAANGADALSIAERHEGPIDLLLTDVVMPGMNGRELADRLTAIRPGTKTLFASGYTENVIVHHGVVDGHLNFIGKPYSPQALAAKIREVLGQS